MTFNLKTVPRCRVAMVVAALLSLPAMAEDESGYWYGGLGIGHSSNSGEDLDITTPAFPGLCTTFPCRTNTGATGYKLIAGYQFTDLLGLEAEYTRLPNTLDVQSVDSTTNPIGILRASQDSEVLSIRGVLTRRIVSPISVSAVVGVGLGRSDIDTAIVGPALSLAASERSHSLSMNFGARINYDFNENIRLRGAWDRYTSLGEASAATIRRPGQPLVADTVHTDTDLFSLEFVYRFR